MVSFEQEIKQYLKANDITFQDHSGSYHLPDFQLLNYILHANKKHTSFYLEVKEKRQKYNTSNWKSISPSDEVYAFILDELSTRKILACAPKCGLLIRNNLDSKYYWFSILDLFLMPKVRTNRIIQKDVNKSLKGKLILDLRNGTQCNTLADAFVASKDYIKNIKHLYLDMTECYGNFINEDLGIQGTVRRAEHWVTDVSETR